MASLVDRKVAEIGDRVWREITSPGGWLYEQIRRHARWARQGFEPVFGLKERKAFTQTVADRIHECGRAQVFRLFGVKLWSRRYPMEWCQERADEIVTQFLADEQIKFGDPAFCWDHGIELADEEMSHWETL